MTAAVTDAPSRITGQPVPPGDHPAHERLRAGGAVVLTTADGHALLVLAAHRASTAHTAFLVRHTSGFLTVALPQQLCQTLELPPMDPFDEGTTRMCVGVDAVDGVSTGISAADRARTARSLLDHRAAPDWFTRPGHLVPVSVHDNEIDVPVSAAAHALALVRAAGLPPGALFAELVGTNDPTAMMNVRDAARFAAAADLPIAAHSSRGAHA
jgi:3,4-dihydroxy-2-butanone 4-phosphate synthase